MAGQYGSSGQRRPFLGRVDLFCLFAVVPMLLLAGLMFWGNLAPVGIGLIVLAGLVVLFDSWSNRPSKHARPEYDDEDDYEPRGRY
ncbi:hypothetical protein [Saccharothrix obliqua]|uniref:hypothetical protein n=1 Tax=Saccharothrix obliqua TaxID=2861747 RepID=UPI001C5DB2DC|nr:hypothetical protein [Saccharothrix obliqua]MBW4721944.1 hypothetical protein [Saccharothrix obliqua]